MNIAIAIGSHAVLTPFNKELALAAFMMDIAPIAIAVPVISSFVRRKVEDVAACRF